MSHFLPSIVIISETKYEDVQGDVLILDVTLKETLE